MKYKPLFITVLTALTAGAAPVAAQPAPEPVRPVLQAAIEASPGKRLFVRHLLSPTGRGPR